jgi:protocatechuate 3,4-dioxygenase beta subunit
LRKKIQFIHLSLKARPIDPADSLATKVFFGGDQEIAKNKTLKSKRKDSILCKNKYKLSRVK